MAIILLVMAGCATGSKIVGSQHDGNILIDVTESYSKKELILQDFMDVEYIPLETNNEFVCQGFVEDIGKEFILVKNDIQNDNGDIYVFDRSGKAVRIINRFGRGGEEYEKHSTIILDEDNQEIFVNSQRKMMVYDMTGKFKRSFNFGDENVLYTNINNFDENHLICEISDFSNFAPASIFQNMHDYNDDKKPITANKQIILIISKQDGKIVREISFFIKERKSARIWKPMDGGGWQMTSPGGYESKIIPYRNSWVLPQISCDTVYRLFTDYSTSPFIVRTPSIQSMNTEIFLLPQSFTERYWFMQTLKKIESMPKINLVYDTQENAIFECVVYNDDYSDKENGKVFMGYPKNDEIAVCQKIEADALYEAYHKGQLKGKLKEVAATLEEESNPVIMLIKYKK